MSVLFQSVFSLKRPFVIFLKYIYLHPSFRNSSSSSTNISSHMAFAFFVGLIAVIVVCTTSGTLAAPTGDHQLLHSQHQPQPASYVDNADYASEYAAYPASSEADPNPDLSTVFFTHTADLNADEDDDADDVDTDVDAHRRTASSSSEGPATVTHGHSVLNDEAVEEYAAALALANRRKRAMQSFIRLGRQPRPSGSGFVRFGRGSNPAPARLDGFMRFGRGGHGFMRFGRNSGGASQMPSDALRFGRRGDNFIRFGKRAGSTLGGGRDAQMLLMDGIGSGEKGAVDEDAMQRLDRIERNGNKQFIRFGRRDDAFMRLGKKSSAIGPQSEFYKSANVAAADSGSGST